MNTYIQDCIINIILNFLDCVMFYYLCNNLINKKPKLSIKTIVIGILYGIIMGTVANILELSAPYTAKIILNITGFFLLKFITRRKTQDVLIIYAIIFVSIGFIQLIAILLLNVLRLGISEGYRYLLVQIITTMIILFLSTKNLLYKFYNMIEKEILLKLLIASLAGILLLTFYYFNFEATTTYIIFFSLFLIIIFLSLFQILRKIFFYTNKVPMQLHDVKNILMGIYLSVYSTSNITVIRNELDKVLEILDIDIGIKDINMNDYNQNILSLINQKKGKAAYHEPTFLTDISYHEPNAKVSFSVILYILGVLLDNAIESGTEKAIIIKISVIEESLFISVSNEYQRKSADDFNKMFQDRYSTKEESTLRGYGLSNLSKVVADYGGHILLKEEYNKEQKSDYITITIEVK